MLHLIPRLVSININQSSRTFSDAMITTSESAIYGQLVSLTAALRFSESKRQHRELLKQRGIDPSSVIQISYEPGEDFNSVFVFPDGTWGMFDFEESTDGTAKRIILSECHEVGERCDDSIQMAHDILSNPSARAAFDVQVASQENVIK